METREWPVCWGTPLARGSSGAGGCRTGARHPQGQWSRSWRGEPRRGAQGRGNAMRTWLCRDRVWQPGAPRRRRTTPQGRGLAKQGGRSAPPSRSRRTMPQRRGLAKQGRGGWGASVRDRARRQGMALGRQGRRRFRPKPVLRTGDRRDLGGELSGGLVISRRMGDRGRGRRAGGGRGGGPGHGGAGRGGSSRRGRGG